MHTYGKTGQQLSATVTGLYASVNAIHTPANSPLPIVVTEHQSHTNADWNSIASTSDSDFEASRLGSQLLYLARRGLSPSPASCRGETEACRAACRRTGGSL